MKSAKSLRIPSYRLHKPTGQAVVTLNGRDHYLGRYALTADGKPDCQEYHRLIGEWLARGQQPAARADSGSESGSTGITVAEVIARYWTHATGWYVKNGKVTSETWSIKCAMRPLKKLYGNLEAVKFGPLALKAVRADMVTAGVCRNSINMHMGRIKRMFKWAASEQIIPGSIVHDLNTVVGLQYGREPRVVETEKVLPVPQPQIDAILPHVGPTIADMIHLQLCTGMRPGELVIMRQIDIDMSRPVWRFTPHDHKTAHHGHARVVMLGASAQEIVKRYFSTNLNAYLFSPRDAEEKRNEARRQARKSPMTPSQAARKPDPRRSRPPRDRYDVNSYRRAIARACEIAFPPPATLAQGDRESAREWKARLTKEQRAALTEWNDKHRWHPHQLRHNYATNVRRQYGSDAARAILGHKSLNQTEEYAELDMQQAEDVVAKIG